MGGQQGAVRGRQSTMRTVVALLLLLLCGGAAAFVWFNRLRGDDSEAIVAFVERFVESCEGERSSADPLRAEVAGLASRARMTVEVLVMPKDYLGNRTVVLRNDAGDEIALQVAASGDAFAVTGHTVRSRAPEAEAEARPSDSTEQISPPRGPGLS